MACANCGKEKNILTKGLCSACNSRLRRTGSLQRTKQTNIGKICSHPECGEPARTKGLCMLHYQQAEDPAKMPWKQFRSQHPGEYPEAWNSFDAFIADVGPRPSAKHQFRRFDPSKPYSKENVRWLAPVNRSYPKNWTVEQRTEYMRQWNFRRYYGITGDDYDRMFAEQGGLCAICRQPERQIAKRSGNIRALHVDHVHDSTQKVRALLCSDCNTMLGHAKDSPTLLRAAAAYLEAHAMAPISTDTVAVSDVRVAAEADGATISWTETPIAPLSLPG